MRFVFTFFLLLSFSVSHAQSHGDIWADISEGQISLSAQSDMAVSASQYRTMSLDFDHLVNVMRLAPMEFSAAAKSQPLQIQMPHPDGSMVDYFVVESPVMHPNLQARYPDIRSFKLWNPNNPSQNGRMDYSPNGVNAIFTSAEGKVLIQPYATEQSEFHYVSYLDSADFSEDISDFVCGHESHDEHNQDVEYLKELIPTEIRGELRNGQPVDLRIFDLALACTGEFAQVHGSTMGSVMAAFNTALNTVNEIFEREVAVRLQLIENNDQLIWLDPLTDPYFNANLGGQLLGQNADAINNTAGIPSSSYDLGHVFTGGCLDVGGVVSGLACTNGKDRGVTCHSSSNVIGVALRIMTHEIAHQFTAAHTWSNCPGILEQLASGSAYEPGSGTTIMSYAGSCGNQNIQFGEDHYYHVRSLEQYMTFTREDNTTEGCETIVPTSNNEPALSLNYENGFYIPISTPFELSVEATDEENDNLTYCWEQYNLGPLTELGNPIGNSPTFRSFPPSSSPTRVFPRLGVLLQNESESVEVLPTYNRDLAFRCTVRDNNPEAGGTVWEQVDFKATESAGPFLVSYPNTTDEVWEAGDFIEVTWDVANTNNNIVNCQFVNIRLSTDFGNTYPIILSENTLNDGSEFITVPVDAVANNRARIKVEAANNIFFDISNENFDIVEPSQPGYTLTPSPSSQQVCLPDIATVDLSTASILAFENPIQLEIIDGLPEGAIASFSANNLIPSESSILSIDMTNVTVPGTYDVTIRAISMDTDTAFRTINFVVVSNDFSDLSLSFPEDGVGDIILGTDFDWTPSANSLFYDFELADHASFAEQDIKARIYGTTATEYQLDPNTILEENELYYWRVRPINECGPGPWSIPSAFHTSSVACEETQSDDVPIPLSGTGLPTIESSLFVEESGIISDVNIPFLRASYQPVNSIRIILESPAETQVVLFDQNCGNTVNFRLGFDDEAPSTIQCPPDDAIVNQPVGNLSDFIGENTFGEWKLIMQVVTSGFGGGGGLDEWNIEFCASLDPKDPFLINNETLEVPPGEETTITTSNLEVQDEDNDATELRYNLVTLPQHGTLRKGDFTLETTGATFTQQGINIGTILYQHDGSDTTEDFFYFTVEDQTGGWLTTQRFNIIIDEGAVVNTVAPIAEAEFLLYPNPAKNELFVELLQGTNDDIQVSLLNVQGQLISTNTYSSTSNRIKLDVSNLASGVYLVSVNTPSGTMTKKVSITK